MTPLRSSQTEVSHNAESLTSWYSPPTDADVDELLARLERVSPSLVLSILGAAQEIKTTMHFAAATGVIRTIYFHPLFMLRNPNNFFDGLCFEVVKRQQPHQKRSDTLAMGGR